MEVEEFNLKHSNVFHGTLQEWINMFTSIRLLVKEWHTKVHFLTSYLEQPNYQKQMQRSKRVRKLQIFRSTQEWGNQKPKLASNYVVQLSWRRVTWSSLSRRRHKNFLNPFTKMSWFLSNGIRVGRPFNYILFLNAYF